MGQDPRFPVAGIAVEPVQADPISNSSLGPRLCSLGSSGEMMSAERSEAREGVRLEFVITGAESSA